MNFLHNPPRFLFFTGKGGVGKTSIACAAAVQLADAGKQVLLVSTDPASNVGQVFGLSIGNQVVAVPAVSMTCCKSVMPRPRGIVGSPIFWRPDRERGRRRPSSGGSPASSMKESIPDRFLC